MRVAILASAIALPTTGGVVTAAVVSPPSGTGATALPERCIVSASIAPVDASAPKIPMRVALPTTWNSKAVMFGGVYLTRLRYAAGAPTRAYFAGGSTGGREALASIQRWPAGSWLPGRDRAS